MSFHLKTEPFGSHQLSTLRHESGAFLQLIPDYGGMIHSLSLVKKGESHSLLTTSPDPEVFQSQLKPGFNGAFLAPFPNRLAFGKYAWEGLSYSMDHNDFGRPNALHGFVFNMPFEMETTGASNGQITLNLDYSGDFDHYPFPFQIINRFQIEDNQLRVISTVTNTGTRPIPFGIGWHPYFSLGTPVNRLLLKMPCVSYYEVGPHLIPTQHKPLNEFRELSPIDSANPDTCYIVAPDECSTLLQDPLKDLTIEVRQGPEYGYIQYYIPEDRSSIAIEPMSCAPDAFNSGNGLIALGPGEQKSFQFQISLI